MQELEDDLDCCTDVDCYCTLDEPCSEYSEEFANYVLAFNFLSNSSYTVRVPLATFVEDGPKNAEGNSTCILRMTNLGSSTNANSIVLGGMFLQQFFAVFTNDYSGTVS